MIKGLIKCVALTVLTIAVATSCSVDEDFSDLDAPQCRNEEKPRNNISEVEIGFRVQTDGDARSNDCCKTESFSITAYDGVDNYYGGNADLVSSRDNGMTWTSDHRRYWPDNRPADWKGLTFYACSQYGNGRMNMDGDTPEIREFKVPDKVEMQHGLMYAVTRDVDVNADDGIVNLNFRNALSEISFTARNQNPEYADIEIISIEVGGIRGEGNYCFPKISSPGASVISLQNMAVEGKWSFADDSQDRSYLLSDIKLSLGACGAAGSGVAVPGSLMMIPQSVDARSGRSSDKGSYFKVTARMTKKGESHADSPQTYFISEPVDWKEGKRYTYDITWTKTFLIFSLCESPE